jgi:hypothetical protein
MCRAVVPGEEGVETALARREQVGDVGSGMATGRQWGGFGEGEDGKGGEEGSDDWRHYEEVVCEGAETSVGIAAGAIEV